MSLDSRRRYSIFTSAFSRAFARARPAIPPPTIKTLIGGGDIFKLKTKVKIGECVSLRGVAWVRKGWCTNYSGYSLSTREPGSCEMAVRVIP